MPTTAKEQMQIELSAEDKTSAAFNALKANMRAVQQQLEQLRKTLSGASGGEIRSVVAGFGELDEAQQRATSSGNNLANTLTRRLILGYLVSQVKDAARTILNLNSELAKLGDTASRAGMGNGSLQGLAFGAQIKGNDPAQFLDTMLKFNQQLDEAKIGVGSLAQLFRANGVAAAGTEDAFLKVADLVKNARTEADKFAIAQQAGLPATREMVKFLEQGSDAIRRQSQEAGKFTDEQIKQAKEIEERFNKLVANASMAGKRAALSFFDPEVWKDALIKANPLIYYQSLALEAGKKIAQSAGIIAGPSKFSRAPVEADPGYDKDFLTPPKPTVNVDAELKKISVLQKNLSILGQLTTATDARRAVELNLQAAILGGASIDDKRAEQLKQQAYDQALGVTAIKATADNYTIEAATIGMTTGAAEQYRAVQSVILENRRKGIELAPDELAYLEASGKLLADRKVMLEGAKLTDEIANLDPFVALQKQLANLDEMLAKGKISWETYGAASQRAMANTVAGAFGLGAQLATALGTIFKQQKAGAYAAAVLNTAESITKTMAQYGATPWGLAAAAVAAASGAAQIATISRTNKDGGGGSVTAPAASIPSIPDIATTASEAAGGAGRSINIHLSGGKNYSEEQVRELIAAINDFGGDGGPTIRVH